VIKITKSRGEKGQKELLSTGRLIDLSKISLI
jgi:hypothetical protein